MGQKTAGYRRNATYGNQTNLLASNRSSKENQSHWEFQVNPKGIVGWNRGTVGRKEKEYGETYNESKRLRKELEELRKNKGCETNGLGRLGTKRTGYVVYGEYRSLRPSKKEVENRETYSFSLEEDRKVGRERVARKYEKRRKTKIERKRTELTPIRKTRGLTEEWEERKKGPGEKRKRGIERSAGVVLGGKIPITTRRVNLIVRELEGGRNHVEILRNFESLRTQHARRSRFGRKRLGESFIEGDQMRGGYYGVHFSVKGPLDGARRTMSYEIERGTIPRGTKRARRMDSRKHAKSNVGTRGVQRIYCYGRG